MKHIRTYILLLSILMTTYACNWSSKKNEVFKPIQLSNKTKNITIGGFNLVCSPVEEENDEAFFSVGEMPSFPGGEDSLRFFILGHIQYPKSAINDNIEGKVFIQFIVDSNGEVKGAIILRSVRADLDSVCLQMVREMPNWEAARLSNHTIAVRLVLPIKFTLTDESKPDTIIDSKNVTEMKKIISRIYPNPTNGLVYVELCQSDVISYTLTDIRGEVIVEGKFYSLINKMDLSKEPEGVYILTSFNIENKSKQIAKIVKTD